MEHFHLIVNGYRFHNIATCSSTKEELFYFVYTHLTALKK